MRVVRKSSPPTSPAEVKALGRKVRGFDEDRWVDKRFEIALRGNLAKFSQNPELRDWLIGTSPAVLVEASPSTPFGALACGR